jgi:hypothetical protein
MATRELEDLVRQAETLSADEKLQLAAALIEQARQGAKDAASEVRWSDLRARVAAPALGEDAQAWVTRTRQEGSQHGSD